MGFNLWSMGTFLVGWSISISMETLDRYLETNSMRRLKWKIYQRLWFHLLLLLLWLKWLLLWFTTRLILSSLICNLNLTNIRIWYIPSINYWTPQKSSTVQSKIKSSSLDCTMASGYNSSLSQFTKGLNFVFLKGVCTI